MQDGDSDVFEKYATKTFQVAKECPRAGESRVLLVKKKVIERWESAVVTAISASTTANM